MSAVEKLSPLQNTALGVVCGSIEVSITQPTLYCKNASQQGLKLSLDPRLLYRGLGVSILNMGIATGLQFPLTGAVTNVIKRGEKRPLGGVERVMAGLVGGMLSALACSPMELIMIQQQRLGTSLLETPKAVIEARGVTGLWRGTTMTSGREGLYTAGYLGIGPVLTEKLQHDYGFSVGAAKIGGAISAGVFAATASHPMDTIKTCMQGDIKGEKYTSVVDTAKTLWAEGGAKRFINGWSFRTGRMIVAVFILAETQQFMAPVMFPASVA